MSKTVDSRVVEMKFDNSNFEKNITQSMFSIDKLKQSLNFKGATKGIEDVSTAAQKCDVSCIGAAAETVKIKFSALEVAAVTALTNITNQAVNTGKRMLSALTIDPIKTGFEEYETKMGSIQTIMSNTASKGTTMEDVTRVIDELNTYADKTIYNFSEMTRNIGTFTAAGIGLEESASAIQGIANLAAASGSTSQQASTAMYQLSQALAAGTVKLMDWNSVVNAGMGGEKFQEALKATARDHGIAVDALIEKNGSFRDSLQEGWISADILNETLRKFTVEGATEYANSMMEAGKWTQEEADALITEAQSMEDAATKVKTFTQLWDTLKESAQSGWGQSWEIIVGNFDEAKELFTQVSDVIGGMINDSATARNEVLQGWKDLGGRTVLIEAIKNAFNGLMSVINTVKEAFSEVFPSITAENLMSFSNGVLSLTEKFKMSDETAANLKATFKGLFSILSAGFSVVKAGVKVAVSLLNALSPIVGIVLKITGTIGGFITSIVSAADKSGALSSVATALSNIISGGLSAAFEAVSGVCARLSERLSTVKGWFSSLAEAVGGSGLSGVLSSLWKAISTVGGAALSFLGSSIKSIITQIGNINFSAVTDLLNTLAVTGTAAGITKFLKSLKESVSEVKDTILDFGGIKDGIAGVFDTLKSSITSFTEESKKNKQADTLQKLAVSLAILAAALIAISLVDSDKLAGSLASMAAMFTELLAAMKVYDKLGIKAKGSLKSTVLMVGMASAMVILAVALAKIGALDWDSLKRGMAGMTVAMAELVAATKILSSSDESKISAGQVVSLVAIAAAVSMLASTMAKLSVYDWLSLARGASGMTAALGELVAAVKILSSSDESKISAGQVVSLVAIAAAVSMLGSTMAKLSGYDWLSLARGASGMSAAIAVLVAAVKVLSSTEKSKISVGQIASLIAIAESVAILGNTMQSLAALDWLSLARGASGVTVAIGELVAAMRIISASDNKFSVTDILVLISFAASVSVLGDAIADLAELSWESLAKGCAGMTVAIGELVAAMRIISASDGAFNAGDILMLVSMAAAVKILAGVIQSLGNMSLGEIAKGLISLATGLGILLAAGALANKVGKGLLVLSGSIALLGVGVAAAGAGIALLAAGLAALGVAFAADGAVIIAAAKEIIWLIPELFASLGTGLVAFFTAVANGAAALYEALVKIVTAAAEAIVTCAPTIAEALLTVLMDALSLLVEYTPQIVDALFTVIKQILNGLMQYVPECVSLLMELFSSVVLTVAESLSELAEPVVELASGFFELVGEGIGNAVGSIINGILNGITSALPDVADDLSEFAENLGPFINVMNTIDESAMRGVKALAEAVLIFTASDFINGIKNRLLLGDMSLSDYATELTVFAVNLKPFAEIIKNFPESFGADCERLATGLEAIVKMAQKIPNEGGLVALITGDNSIKDFAAELSNAGPDLMSFASSIEGLPESFGTNCEALSAGMSALCEMAKDIPNEGGLVALITGDNSIAGFAAELATAGPDVVTFAENVAGLPTNFSEVCGAFADGLAILVDISNVLPKEGGLKALFEGDNSIGRFAEELANASWYFGQFTSVMAGGGQNDILESIMNLRSLISFAEKLSGIDTSLIEDFGEALKSCASDINAARTENFETFTSAMSTLCTDVSKLDFTNDSFGDLERLIKACTDIGDVYPTKIKSLGSALKSFANDISKADTSNFAGFSSAFMSFAASISASDCTFVDNIDAEKVTSVGEALRSFADNVNGADTNYFESFATAFKSLSDVLAECDFSSGEFAGLSEIVSYAADISAIDSSTIVSFATSMNTLAAKIDNAKTDNFADFAASMGALCSVLSGLNFSNESFDDLQSLVDTAIDISDVDTSKVKSLATALKTFADKVGDMSVESFSTVSDAFATFNRKLSGCEFIFGSSDTITSAATAIDSLITVATHISWVDTEAVTNFGTAIKSVSDNFSDASFKVESLTDLGSVVSYAVNISNVDSEAVTAFGVAVKVLCNNINNAQTSNMGTFSEALKNLSSSLAECNFSNESLGSLSDLIGYAGDISNLNSSDIKDFGKALKTCADKISKASTDNFASLGEALKTLSSDLSECDFTNESLGSLADLIGYAEDMSNITSSNISTLGTDLASFASSVNGMEVGNFEAVGTAFSTLSEKLFDCKFLFGSSMSISASAAAIDSLAAVATRISKIDSSSIVSFGEAFKSLSDNLSQCNFADTSNIASQLSSFANEGINAFISAFDEAAPKLKSAGTSLVTGVVEGVMAVSAQTQLQTAGGTSAVRVKTGFENKNKDLKTAGENAAAKAVAGIKSKHTDFYNIGVNSIEGFIKGMNSKMSSVKETAVGIAQAALNSANSALDINSPSKEFKKTGESVGEGFVLGIQNGERDVEKASENLAEGVIDTVQDVLEIHSPSAVMNEQGHYIVQGIAEGIEEDTSAEDAAEQKANNIISAFSEVFSRFEAQITKAGYEFDIWSNTEGLYASSGDVTNKSIELLTTKIAEQENIVAAAADQYSIMVENFGEGSDEAIDAYNTLLSEQSELTSLQSELTADNYEYSKSWIENSEKYGLIGDTEVIDAWGRMIEKYSGITEYREEIFDNLESLSFDDYETTQYLISALEQWQQSFDSSSEAYQILGSIIAGKKSEAIDQSYSDSMDWISKAEDFGILQGSGDKLASYLRVLNTLTALGDTSSDNYYNTLQNVYDLIQEIYEAQKDYEEELSEMEAERAEERLELEEEYADEVEAINEQLEADIADLEKSYEDALESRTDALYNAYGLFDEVAEVEEVDPETLYNNLEDQVERMQDWRAELDELADRGLDSSLIEELQDMGVSSYAEIKALNSMTDSQLEQYATLWADKHQEATDQATDELDDYLDDVNDRIAELNEQAADDLAELKTTYDKALEEFDEATETALDDITKTYQEKVGIVRKDVPKQFAEMSEAAIGVLEEVGWDESGQAIVTGLVSGISSEYDTLMQAVADLGYGALNTWRAVTNTNSPSKEFAKLGTYIDLGLVEGIESSREAVFSELETLGEDMIDIFADCAEMEYSPEITPVVNLDDVYYAADSFGADTSVGLVRTVSFDTGGLREQIDDMLAGLGEYSERSDERVTAAIEDLRGDMAAIADRIERLQVVMDTGTLVGAITPEMNKSLGKAAIRTRRGI